MKKIAIEVQRCIHRMQGEWLAKKSSYEKKLCSVLQWEVVDSRYYDAITENNSLIEIKKGINGMHFDMIRYAEILLGKGVENTITIYFHWRKDTNKVVDVCIINTKVLMTFLQINNHYAKIYEEIKHVVPRGVSVMANVTSLDLRAIADYVVLWDGRIVDNSALDKSKYAPNLFKKQNKDFLQKTPQKNDSRSSIMYYLY